MGVVLDMTAHEARTDDEREVKHAKSLRRLAGGVAEPPRATEAEETASGTILVVDDDSAVRRIATRILADAGFEILEAENGRAALAILARHDGPVALVLTDLVMPEMDGRELCRRLAEERPELPVLPMSGFSAAASVSTEQPPNVVGFLAKPFTPSQLVQKVREIVEARTVTPSA